MIFGDSCEIKSFEWSSFHSLAWVFKEPSTFWAFPFGISQSLEDSGQGEFQESWRVQGHVGSFTTRRPAQQLYLQHRLDARPSARDPLITLLPVVQRLPMALRINPMCSHGLLGLRGLAFVVFCLDSF